jgi:hypothetical protein
MWKMFWIKLFGQRKLYKVVYDRYGTHTTIVEAKDECRAIKKFHKMFEYTGIKPSIISFERYWVQ